MATKEPVTSFQKKVWTVLSIAALFVIVIWILKVTVNVLLLVLAAVLIACYFRGLSNLLQRKVHLGPGPSLLIAIIGSFLLLIGFFWFTGNRIQQQITQLSETLPAGIDRFNQELSRSPLGRKVLEQVKSGGESGKLAGTVRSFFRSTFGVLGDIYVILFLGIFFTASPKVYVNGMVRLAPPPYRDRTKEVLATIGQQLTKWLKGKLFAMLVVTVLTATGLLIIGMPMAFALALVAGVLNFIPNFGPLIAMIPAVLIGFMQSPTTALLVAGLYILVQVLESNIITPQIQKRLIQVPPALIILAQLFMGVLTGGWGLVIATPIVVILIVLIQELYLKEVEKEG